MLRRRAPELESAFEDAAWEATAAAQAANGDVHADPKRWVSMLLGASKGTLATLRDLRAHDLWLATALVDGDAAAMSVFESELMPEVDRALNRFVSNDDERAELRQQVRIRLLVADSESAAPRISTYSGLGRLASWVRTTAGRLALNLRRASDAHARADTKLETVLPESPELALLKAEDRTLFKTLLKSAFQGLEQRERTLLRLRYAQGMTAVSLARAYGVHESTLSRRLDSARKTMAEAFGTLAAKRLGLHDAGARVEARHFLQSRIEWSLDSILRSRDG